jgi:glucose-6-phosphate isomerase
LYGLDNASIEFLCSLLLLSNKTFVLIIQFIVLQKCCGNQFLVYTKLYDYPMHSFRTDLEQVHYVMTQTILQGVAITQENSLLDNTARIEGWLDRFPMFDWVGGRTSELSAVGLLPAALQVSVFYFPVVISGLLRNSRLTRVCFATYQGIDVKEMLIGAALMDEETRNTVVWDFTCIGYLLW